MIPLIRRIAAPIRMARADVSPIVPCTFPMKRLNRSTVSPDFMAARGVAPDTVSTIFPQAPSGTAKSVILPVKEISRKHLAARAGFIKFCPRPPKSCFTTKMAKTPPITTIHQGALGGRFSASRRPVTTAL